MDPVALAALSRAKRNRSEIFQSRLHEFEFITRFQPGHGFAFGGGTGTVTESATSPLFGDQCIEFTRAGGGATPSVYKTGLSLDLTQNTLAVWIRRSNNSGGVNVFASDASLENYYYWNAGGITPVLGAGEWDYYLLSIQSAFSVTGSPNRAKIERLHFTGNIASDSAPNYLGAVALVKNSVRYPNGVVSITFDDSLDDAYFAARPIMDAFGYGGTGYFIASRLGSAGVPTLTELHRMENLHGWEVAGHAYAQHVDWTTLAAGDLNTELTSLRSWLVDNGFRGQDHLAYPFGARNEGTKTAVRDAGFYSARVVSNGERNALPPEPARLHELNAWDGNNPIATNLGRLDGVADAKSWGVFMFHTLDRGDLTSADFTTFLERIDSLGLAVAPVGDVLGTWSRLAP